MRTAFTFAVIADSHFHPDGPPQAAWEADAAFNKRNEMIVAMIERADPDFVIHVGDVPHPIPGLQRHEQALDVAQRTYSALQRPMYVVPGNHDIGDKPHPWAPAPTVDDDRRAAFAQRWGPLWQSFVHQGCRFVLIDTPILNSGLPAEDEQWAWLAAELAKGPERVLAFLHYPPFLMDPDEPEHYDNIAEPARSRLLALLASAEAVFCGHVHRFFWNPLPGGGDLYIAPATSFVRPGYSELGRIAPAAAFGRDDIDKLGMLFVHVDEHRVVIEPARADAPAFPALCPGRMPPPCPVGVTLRHAWDQPMDIPADGLDPFRRKRARDDLVVEALWELGIDRLRLPIEDLVRPDTRRRLVALARHGQRAILFSAADITPVLPLLAAHRDIIEAVELIVPRLWLTRGLLTLPARDDLPPLWLSAVGREDAVDSQRFSHFPQPGFRLGEEALSALPEGVAGVVFSVTDWLGVQAATAAAGERTAVAVMALPKASESVAFTDDAATAAVVLEAALAGQAFSEAVVLLDGFVDHDRGYFPRNALLDRRSDPRPALHALRNLSRLLAAGGAVSPCAGGFSVDGLGRVLLPAAPALLPAGLDLVHGTQQPAGESPWPRLVV